VVVDDSESHMVWTNGREPLTIVSLWFLPEFVCRPGLSLEIDFDYITCFCRHGKNSVRYIPASETEADIFRVMGEKQNSYICMLFGRDKEFSVD
jgi:hypothetical protein